VVSDQQGSGKRKTREARNVKNIDNGHNLRGFEKLESGNT